MATEKEIDYLVSEMTRLIKQMSSGAGAARSISRSRSFASRGTSRSDDDDEDTKKDLNDAAKKLTKQYTSLSSVVKDIIKNQKYADEIMSDQTEVLDEFNALQTAMNAKMKDSTKIFSQMEKQAYRLNGSMSEQMLALKNQVGATKNLNSEFAKAAVRSSMLNASMLESHELIEKGTQEYYDMTKTLSEAAKPLQKSFLESADAWDETTESLKSDLSPSEFAALRRSLGAFEAALKDDLVGIKAASLDEVFENLKKQGLTLAEKLKQEGSADLQAALISAVMKASASGVKLEIEHNGEKSSNLDESGNIDKDLLHMLQESPEALQAFADSLNSVSKQNQEAIRKLDTETLHVSNSFANLAIKFKSALPTLDKLKAKLIDFGSAATAGTFASKALSAAQDAYRETVDFNTAQIPESFGSASISAAKLGMSMGEYVKFAQQNKRIIQLQGKDAAQFTKQFQGTFEKFGYNMKQAAEVIPSMTEAAASSGISIRNSKALNTYAQQTMQRFQDLSKVVSITAEEYYDSLAAINNESSTRANMIGRSAEDAQKFAADNEIMRNRFLKMGLSMQTATDLIIAQNRAAKEPLVNRMRDAAKINILAGQMGMSNADRQELTRLKNKNELAKTAEEKTREAELMKQLGVKIEERQYAARNNEGELAVIQNTVEALSPQTQLSQTQMEAGIEAAQAERAGKKVTDEEAEEMKSTQGSEAAAKLSSAVNMITAALQNSFLKAIGFSVLALGSLAISAGMAALQLRAMGGSGLTGGLGQVFANKTLPKFGKGTAAVRKTGVARTAGVAERAARIKAASTGAQGASTATKAAAGGGFLAKSLGKLKGIKGGKAGLAVATVGLVAYGGSKIFGGSKEDTPESVKSADGMCDCCDKLLAALGKLGASVESSGNKTHSAMKIAGGALLASAAGGMALKKFAPATFAKVSTKAATAVTASKAAAAKVATKAAPAVTASKAAAAKVSTKAATKAKPFAKAMGAAGKLGGKILGPAAALLDVFGGYSDFKDADEQLKSGEIDRATANKMKGQAIGGAMGSIAGTIGGAFLGPVGAMVGSVAGNWLGSKAGGFIGSLLGDRSASEVMKEEAMTLFKYSPLGLGKSAGSYIGNAVSNVFSPKDEKQKNAVIATPGPQSVIPTVAALSPAVMENATQQAIKVNKIETTDQTVVDGDPSTSLLQQISQNMQATVDLLKIISEKEGIDLTAALGTTKRKTNLPKTPSYMGFMTGRT